jgi:hypothetical protein
MSFWGGSWDPLNWPSDIYHSIASSFMSELEKGLLYLFYQLLLAFLGLYNSIIILAMQTFNSFLSMIAYSAISLGPLSLPIFTLGLTAVLCVAYLAFLLAKDTPVVGAFV